MTNTILKNKERLAGLVAAYQEVTGKRYQLSTPFRHATKGVRGIFLESIMVGGRRLTSVEAVIRFFCATTAAAEQKFQTLELTTATRRSDRERLSRIAAAERELNADGI